MWVRRDFAGTATRRDGEPGRANLLFASLAADFRVTANDRNRHANAIAHALRPRLGCGPIRRLAAGTGLLCVRRDAGAWHDRPRDRTSVSRCKEQVAMTTQCATCLGKHDPEFHASTLRIRAWLRAHLELVQKPLPVPQQKSQPHQSSLGSVKSLRCPASRRKAARE
jgi:hypothetical protein